MNRNKFEEVVLLAIAVFFVVTIMIVSVAGLLGVEW